MDPSFPLTHQRLGLAYVQKEMFSEAIGEFQHALNKSNRAPQLGYGYAVSGNKVEAQNLLDELKGLSPGALHLIVWVFAFPGVV